MTSFIPLLIISNIRTAACSNGDTGTILKVSNLGISIPIAL
jgi:hypothetical protein